MKNFNPYTEWLGIPAERCPPNYYDLLGILPAESEIARIEQALEERLKLVKSFQHGPRGKQTQQLLNDLARAKICLLNPDSKQDYDRALTGGLAKPPIAPIVKDEQAIPPLVQNAINLQSENGDIASPATRKPKARNQWMTVYLLVLAIVVPIIWWYSPFASSSGSTVDQQLESASDNSKEASQETKLTRKSRSSKQSEQIKKQGLLPGSNNTYELTRKNSLARSQTEKQPTSDTELNSNQQAKEKLLWEIWIDEPGFYESIITYNATTNEKLSRIRLQVDDKNPDGVSMRQSSAPDEFLNEEIIVLFREPGLHRIQLFLEGDQGDFQLKSIEVRPNRMKRR